MSSSKKDPDTPPYDKGTRAEHNRNDASLQTDHSSLPGTPSDPDPDCSASMVSSCSSSGSDPSLPDRIKPLLKPPVFKSSRGIKQAILQAVEILECENEELKVTNADLESEIARLREENQKLKAELRENKENTLRMTDDLERHQTDLDSLKEQHEFVQAGREALEEENRDLNHRISEYMRSEQKYEADRANYTRQLENLKRDLQNKSEETTRMKNQVQSLNRQVDSKERRNYSDRDIELRQEIELLKSEKRELYGIREDLERSNKKLRAELNNLQAQLDQRFNELKNEQRRHSLLTKEFNSLLEENNHLKLQLRRRHQTAPTDDPPPPTAHVPLGPPGEISSAMETVVSLSGHTDQSLSSSRSQNIKSRDMPRSYTPRSMYSRQDTKLTASLGLPQLQPKGSSSWRP